MLTKAVVCVVAGVALMAGLVATPAAASTQQVVANSSRDYYGWWSWFTDAGCNASIENQQTWSNDKYGLWWTAAAAAQTGGTLSIGASIQAYLGFSASYAPNPYCRDAVVLPGTNLAVDTLNLVYDGDSRTWLVCYNSGGWIYKYQQSGGGGWEEQVGAGFQCGAEWYLTEGEGITYQNGAWQGWQPYLMWAGNCNTCWLYFANGNGPMMTKAPARPAPPNLRNRITLAVAGPDGRPLINGATGKPFTETVGGALSRPGVPKRETLSPAEIRTALQSPPTILRLSPVWKTLG